MAFDWDEIDLILWSVSLVKIIVNEGDGCASFGCVNTGWAVNAKKEWIWIHKIYKSIY